jgi:hypothetical protein
MDTAASSGIRSETGGDTLLLLPGSELGAGGQATVYPVPGREDRVAKIYHQPTPGQERKLRLMLTHRPAGASAGAGGRVFAWPLDLLRDGGGRCVGLLLPRVDGKLRVFELYNPATRRDRAPLFHHGLLHRAARNLAAAFHELHEAGFVVGDVNESNILVGEDGRVTLIDTDSFQVRDPVSGEVFRCPVGRPEFTPPELREHRFAEVDRAPEHDRFGLGVLVFQMLMEGTHPFAGRWRGEGEPPPVEERIAAGHFPYAGLPGVPLEPARTAPPLEVLDPGVRDLLARCFVDGHRDPAARPGADEWRDALAAAEGALVACGRNEQHLHGAHQDACPWCERARRLEGRDPFPSARAVERGEHRRRAARPRVPGRGGPSVAPGPRFQAVAQAGNWPMPAPLANALLWAALLVALFGVVSAAVAPLTVALVAGAMLAVGRSAGRLGTPARWATALTVVLVVLGFFADAGPAGSVAGVQAPPASGAPWPPGVVPPVNLVYSVATVDRKPVLVDPERFRAAVAMLRREAADSLPTRTNLTFTVDVNGRIDPSGMSTTFPAESAGVNRAAAEFLRVLFRPATLGGKPVRTDVGVPLEWTGGSARPLLEAATWNPGVDSLPDVESLSGPAPRELEAAEAADVADMDVAPQLLNTGEVQALMAELYPPHLRDAGTTGQAQLKFVIDAKGRPVPSSISVVSATHTEFAEVSAAMITIMRFTPAQLRGRAVPVLVAIPITWILEPG